MLFLYLEAKSIQIHNVTYENFSNTKGMTSFVRTK